MRILIVFFLIPILGFTQLPVKLDKVLHDFGDVFENGGEVFAQFKITNSGEHTIQFVSLEPSCGCAAVLTEDPMIEPGKSTYINLKYDPKGRPGNFFKSVEMVLSDKKQKQTIYLGIRGRVIQEFEKAEQREVNIDSLSIPPYTAPFRTAWDTAWLETTSLNKWINALTYEIDLKGFLHLNFTLNIPQETDEKRFLWLSKTVKNRIQNEMKLRGYPKDIILFSDSIKRIENLDYWKMGVIRLSSMTFNNDSIDEPVILRQNISKENQNNVRSAFYRFSSSPKKLKNTFKEEALNLMTQINRKIREYGESQLIITYNYPIPWNRSDAEKHFNKKSKKFYRWLDKYINQRDQVKVSARFNEFSGDTVSVFFTWEPKVKSFHDPYYIEFEKRKIPSILLPVYKKEMPEEAFRLDTSDRDFLRMMSNIKKHLQADSTRKISFEIQSVADARPNRNYSDRSYLARKRGEKILEDLNSFIQNYELSDSLIVDSEILTWVRGWSETSEYYDVPAQNNNYISIVPTFIKDSVTKSLLPYKVNFDQAFLEIDNTSPFFNAFVDGLVEIINMKGSVTVIIESSSSQAPLNRGPSPIECSVIRGESMIDVLSAGLHERGISPQRLLIKEVNHVVAGPVYEGNYNPEKFQPFQYVKVIPVNKD